MKTTNLKGIAYALSALMLLQSCSVYHNRTATIDEAIATNNKVKIVTSENIIYKFDRIEKKEGEVYGVTKLKKLDKEIFAYYVKEINQEKRTVKILFPFDIKEIHTKNKIMSIVVTLWPVWLIGLVSGIIVANGGISVGGGFGG